MSKQPEAEAVSLHHRGVSAARVEFCDTSESQDRFYTSKSAPGSPKKGAVGGRAAIKKRPFRGQDGVEVMS